MSKLIALFVCCVATTLSIATGQGPPINVDELYHGNRPTSNANQPVASTSTDQAHSGLFQPFRESRHDEFDFALMKKVLTKDDKNAVLSPFIVKTLLSILAEASGPDTITHRELVSVTPSLATFEDIRKHYGKVYGSLLQPNSDYELNLGAKMFVDKFINPQQRFASIMQHNYHSDIEQVDFAKVEETTNLINAWCSNATRRHITNIVTPDDVQHAIIMLINTIYFNGFWTKPFPENETRPGTFFLNAQDNIQVPFMKIVDNFYYANAPEVLDAKVLRLPYIGNKFAMTIILPNRRDGIDELISKIDSSVLHRLQYLMEENEINVTLPKFKIVNTVHLNEILKALRIRQMFTLQASFPQLVRGLAVQDRLQVSSVVQKTGIDVNEKGSTVYSATVTTLSNKFGGEIEFIADHPFIFTIEDETTGTLLFTGKVVKPEY